MSFDTTARQRLATGAEKQDMPACLPMVSLSGDERATMQHETSTGITVEFTHAEDQGEPLLILKNVPGLPGNHAYSAASLLTAAAHDEQFIVGADWSDQQPFPISREDVNAIACWAYASSSRKRGQFVIAWVPADHSCPF